jgi:adenylate cyclase
MEIERKWRLEKLPDCCVNSLRVEIDQGYIFDGPFSLRLRRSCTGWRSNYSYRRNYTLTVKGSGHLARDEWEVEIPKWVFDNLWTKVENYISKDRLKVHLIDPDFLFEFDEYKGKLSGLLILECEFASVEEANAFVLPEWIVGAVEVTYNPLYKNSNLAKINYLNQLG